MGRYTVKQLTGLNRNRGDLLPDHDHIKQSIEDILTTPIGSRVMRRDYGSLLSELMDRPLDERLMMLLHSLTATAVMRWEPRIRLSAVHIEHSARGRLDLTLHWERLHPTSRATGLYKFEISKR